MLTSRIRFSLFILFSLSATLVMGQAARSPFSSYGLGDAYTTALTNSQGMGGVGVSNPQFWFVNNQNPALLVFNRLTTFQAGLIGEQRSQLSDATSEKSGSGNLNYLVLGIPIKPGAWGSAIGLMPYTRLNYMLKYTTPINGPTPYSVNVQEEGTGGINQFYFSNGVSINRKLSLGLKAAYLFSSATNDFNNAIDQPDVVYTVYPKVSERTFISDFQFSPAISLHYDSLFKRDYRLNFGLVYDFKTNANAEFNLIADRVGLAGTPLNSDTLINNAPGNITLPSTITAGISFGRSYVWTAAIDGSYGYYSEYRNLVGENPYGSDYWRISGGFEITPDPVSLSNFLKRLTYRTGVSYENYPYLVNGNAVRDFGITFGFSLPVSRVSSLDLALKVGKKGDKATNTLEENYLKLYFGITFNDQWFVKRRFD